MQQIQRVFRNHNREIFLITDPLFTDDIRLTPFDKGVLSKLLANKDTWNPLPRTVAKQMGASPRKIRSTYKTLIDIGYMFRIQHKNNGRWSYTDYFVFETPELNFYKNKTQFPTASQISTNGEIQGDRCAEIRLTEKVTNRTSYQKDITSNQKDPGAETTAPGQIADVQDNFSKLEKKYLISKKNKNVFNPYINEKEKELSNIEKNSLQYKISNRSPFVTSKNDALEKKFFREKKNAKEKILSERTRELRAENHYPTDRAAIGQISLNEISGRNKCSGKEIQDRPILVSNGFAGVSAIQNDSFSQVHREMKKLIHSRGHEYTNHEVEKERAAYYNFLREQIYKGQIFLFVVKSLWLKRYGKGEIAGIDWNCFNVSLHSVYNSKANVEKAFLRLPYVSDCRNVVIQTLDMTLIENGVPLL